MDFGEFVNILREFYLDGFDEFSESDYVRAGISVFDDGPVYLKNSDVEIIVAHEGKEVRGVEVCGERSYFVEKNEKELLGIFGDIAERFGVSYRKVNSFPNEVATSKFGSYAFCLIDNSMGRDVGTSIENVVGAQNKMDEIWVDAKQINERKLSSHLAKSSGVCVSTVSDKKKLRPVSRQGRRDYYYDTIIDSPLGEMIIKEYILALVRERLSEGGRVSGWREIGSLVNESLADGMSPLNFFTIRTKYHTMWRNRDSINS